MALRAVSTPTAEPAAPLFKPVAPGGLPITLGQAKPEFDVLVARRGEILAAIAADKAKVRVAQAKIAANADGDARKRKSLAIIAGDEDADIATAREELTRLYRRVEDHEAAVPQIDQMILAARSEASTRIREISKGEHSRLVADMCRAMLAVHSASLAYARFTNFLNENDINWTALEPMFALFLQSPEGDGGQPGVYLREACRLGFFNIKDVPEALR